jgi:hypothetical protein
MRPVHHCATCLAASGAAAIPPETLEYILGLGFTVTEVWDADLTAPAPSARDW